MGSDLSRGWGDDPTVALDPTMHVVEGAVDETKFSAARKTVTDRKVRCNAQVVVPHEVGEFKLCGKFLAELVGRPWILVCPRCKATNQSPE